MKLSCDERLNELVNRLNFGLALKHLDLLVKPIELVSLEFGIAFELIFLFDIDPLDHASSFTHLGLDRVCHRPAVINTLLLTVVVLALLHHPPVTVVLRLIVIKVPSSLHFEFKVRNNKIF